MIATAHQANFTTNFESSKLKDTFKLDTNIASQTKQPSQQQTPTASPIMERESIAEEVEETEEEKKKRAQQGLASIFGPAITSWPYTESSLIHAISLKAEQEKTKQEYYKLETVNRSLELLKHSIQAHVPPNLIPLIFAGQNMTGEDIEKAIKAHQQAPMQQQPLVHQQPLPHFQAPPLQQQQQQQGPYARSMESFQRAQPLIQQQQQQPIPPPPQRSLHESNPFRLHERSQTISTPRDLMKSQKMEEFSTPPMPTGFRFGGDHSAAATPSSTLQNPPVGQPMIESPTHGSSKSMMMSRPRQLSPAKMGAQAVASLNSRFRSGLHQQQHHSRTTSLPPQVSIPESTAVTFHREKAKEPDLPTVKTPSPSKPVILQHQLIQFHHWTPNESETTPNKRRRSDESDADEKSISQLKDDNALERRKFITTHTRTRSDTSLIDMSQGKENDKSARAPKYPDILSNDS